MTRKTKTRRRAFGIDVLGSSILVALILVGGLIVGSAQGPGELGFGVALACVSLFLLVKEVRYAIDASRARDGDSND